MPTASVDLNQFLLRQQPPAAVPLNLPLYLPEVDPEAPPRKGIGDIVIEREERARTRQQFLQQREVELAREAEIFKRESAQREQLRRAIGGGEPAAREPRVTNRTPEWEKSYQSPPNPRPSAASPPPTLRTSGAGAVIEAEFPPSTAAPRSPIGTNPAPTARPPGIPSPAGLAVGGGLSAGLDFANRIVHGQDPATAAGGAAATGLGTVAGTIAGGAIAGPIGAFVGGFVGGYVGGSIYNNFFLPKPAATPTPVTPYQAPPQFQGGQALGVKYRVDIRIDHSAYSQGFDTRTLFVWGVFEGLIVDETTRPGSHRTWSVYYRCHGRVDPSPRAGEFEGYLPQMTTFYLQDFDDQYNYGDWSIRVTSVTRLDGQPDTSGNPAPQPLYIDNRSYTTINQIGGAGNAPPRAETAPAPAPTNYAPPGLGRDGGTPRGDSPNWIPTILPAPPAPIPSTSPPGTPNSTGAPPSSNASPTSLGGTATANPDGSVTFSSPGSATGRSSQANPADVALPRSFTPISLTPTPLTPTSLQPNPLSNSGSFTQNAPTETPAGLPQTAPTQPQPDATKPVPTAPAPQPQLQPATQKQFEDLQKQFRDNAIVLAGLTPIIQEVVRNTAEDKIRKAANAGTCEAFAPQGCAVDIRNNAQQAANNSAGNSEKLNALNTLLQGLDLGVLKVINDKLGAQLPGGISGFLGRAFKATRLDKIINALTLITALHNAAMLSRSLASTLGDLTSQALATIGIKDENDSPLDINKEISRQVNNLMSTILGEDVWEGTKTNWNKANAIISSASQIVYTVRSIADSGREVTEWIANNTGKIGNALKRFRVVGENAYPHMSENVTHQNAWMLKIQRYREGVDNLDDAASSLQGVLGEVGNIQSEFKELQEQKQKFDTAVQSATPKTIPDNAPVKTQRETELAASKAPANAADVFRGEGETANA
jgi:hypothetical protein